MEVPPLPGRFGGTGDLLASLLLGWSCQPATPPDAVLRRSVASVQAVLRSTLERAALSPPPPPTASRGGIGAPPISRAWSAPAGIYRRDQDPRRGVRPHAPQAGPPARRHHL